MWAPGLVGLVVGALLLLGVRDSPESCGFPPVEVVAVKKKADGRCARCTAPLAIGDSPAHTRCACCATPTLAGTQSRSAVATGLSHQMARDRFYLMLKPRERRSLGTVTQSLSGTWMRASCC